MRERSPLVTELSPPCAADHSVTCTRLHPLLTVSKAAPCVGKLTHGCHCQKRAVSVMRHRVAPYVWVGCRCLKT